MVMITESFPVDEEDMLLEEQEQEQEKDQKQTDKPTLSKSWTEQSAHAPSYSGGKVTLCHTKGTRHLYGYDDLTKEDNTATPFILAPCAGDLTLIDALHGIKARTIREGCARVTNEDEDEDESIDNDAIVTYALSSNDCDLITASRNNILRHYDISGSPSHSYSGGDGRGGAKVRKVLGRSGHDLPITCIEFHCSGSFFATGSVDGNVKVWDIRKAYVTHSFRFNAPGYTATGNGGLRGSVTCLNWCPDNTKLWLGVGRDDGSVRVHDLKIKEEEENIVEMTDHVGAVTCMMWASGNGKPKDFDTFFTAGRDSVVNTWAISEEERSKSTQAKKKKKGSSSEGKQASLRHFNHGAFLQQSNVSSFLAPSPSTKMAYKRVHTLPVYENVEQFLILPDFHFYYTGKKEVVSKSDIVVATAGSKGVVKLWKTARRQVEGDALGSISGLKLLAEQDESLAFGEKRGGYTGLLLTSFKHEMNKAGGTSAAGSRSELIAVDADHNISFLSLIQSEDEDGPSLLGLNRTIIGHNDEILDLKIIPDPDAKDGDGEAKGRRVAVATNSAQVRLFELGSYSCTVLDGHTDTVLSIDVSPCGRYLATSGKDQTMRLWHLKTGKCVAVATGHTEAVGASALSRKIGRFDVAGKAAKNGGGSFAVTASKDRTLKRWNLPGSSVLDGIGNSDEDSEELHVFASIRAHDKVGFLCYV